MVDTDCKKLGLEIHFKYTVPRTPQQNGLVERTFATLYGRIRSMMNGANIPRAERDKKQAECAATTTKLEAIITKDGKPSLFEKYYGQEAPYAQELRTFGEVGIIDNKAEKDIAAKLTDKGKLGIFLGYARNHTPVCTTS